MSYVILLISTAAGVATEFDGQYLQEYDPSFVHPDGYDGGILVTTPNLDEARRFPTVAEAFDCYRTAYGLREDGLPNRPLTAWSVEVFEP